MAKNQLSSSFKCIQVGKSMGPWNLIKLRSINHALLIVQKLKWKTEHSSIQNSCMESFIHPITRIKSEYQKHHFSKKIQPYLFHLGQILSNKAPITSPFFTRSCNTKAPVFFNRSRALIEVFASLPYLFHFFPIRIVVYYLHQSDLRLFLRSTLRLVFYSGFERTTK